MPDEEFSSSGAPADVDSEIRELRQELLRLVLQTVRENPGMPVPVTIESGALNALTADVMRRFDTLEDKLRGSATTHQTATQATHQRFDTLEKKISELKRLIERAPTGGNSGARNRGIGEVAAGARGIEHEATRDDEKEDEEYAEEARARKSARRVVRLPQKWLFYLLISAGVVAFLAIVALLAGWRPLAGGAPAVAPPDTQIIYDNELDFGVRGAPKGNAGEEANARSGEERRETSLNDEELRPTLPDPELK